MPATDKQLSFLRSLLSERDVPEDERSAIERGLADGTIDKDRASRGITWLLAQPRRAGVAAPQAGPLPEVADGRYAVELGGVLRFFRVDRPTEGRWAGRLFLNEVVGGRDRGMSIREWGEKRRVLEALASDPGALARYGRELGRCGYCNRELTDELSRAVGIGPDCADRHGVDRGALAASLRDPAIIVGGQVVDMEMPEPEPRTCAECGHLHFLGPQHGYCECPIEGCDCQGQAWAQDEGERRMQEMEAAGDLAGTIRDEVAKHAARAAMEGRSEAEQEGIEVLRGAALDVSPAFRDRS